MQFPHIYSVNNTGQMIYLLMQELFKSLDSYFLSCLLSVKYSINSSKNALNKIKIL